MTLRSLHHHISIATPTAPPTTHSISFNTLPVLTAPPFTVCRPGVAAVPVPVPSVAPAPPVGVGAAASGTTVIAVTIDLLPLGRVLVCTTVLVREDLLVVIEAVAEMVELGLVVEGGTEPVEIVLAPPPAVVTMTTP